MRLVSALQVLAEDPKLIDAIFLKRDQREIGIYALQLYKDDRPVVVIIDDFIPAEYEVPIQMEDSYLWVFFIQKARAKLAGTYLDSFNMEVTPQQMFSDLTGKKTQYFENIPNLLAVIEHAKNSENIVALIPKNDDFLPSNLEYSIETVLMEEFSEPILRIRLPQWVTVDWTGDWSKTSDKWSAGYKKKYNVDSEEDKHKYSIWMSWADIQDKFSNLLICEIKEPTNFELVEEKAPELDFGKLETPHSKSDLE